MNSVLLKKRTRLSKRNEYMNKMLSFYSSMIDPEILKNKFVKNLMINSLNPEKNVEDKIILIKGLIAGVLKVLNIPDDKIESRLTTISKEDLFAIMKILIKFHKTTSHVDVLQQLGQYKIEGLDVSQISPGLAISVTDFLFKYIRLHGR